MSWARTLSIGVSLREFERELLATAPRAKAKAPIGIETDRHVSGNTWYIGLFEIMFPKTTPHPTNRASRWTAAGDPMQAAEAIADMVDYLHGGPCP